MSPEVSVIIPTLNEESGIAAAIQSAFHAGAAEVIVSDGGSSDGTLTIAAAEGARVLTGKTMRAAQMNDGAAEATSRHLIFLHADSLLPLHAAAMVEAALAAADFGGFRIAFIESKASLRIAAFLINCRTRITRCPWGDQAQFIGRDRFLESGGFLEIPLMEDYELATRMRRQGRTIILPSAVRTSGRRFLRLGVLRTAARNWRIVAAFKKGANPADLARSYKE
jgi:rSAM/selenodomain-associated transferase 2